MTLKNDPRQTLRRDQVAKRLRTTYHAVAMRDRRKPNDLKPFWDGREVFYYKENIESYLRSRLKR